MTLVFLSDGPAENGEDWIVELISSRGAFFLMKRRYEAPSDWSNINPESEENVEDPLISAGLLAAGVQLIFS